MRNMRSSGGRAKGMERTEVLGVLVTIQERAVSQVSKPTNAPQFRRPADLEIGDTAGLETCATPVLPRQL
jgi:hypothetical protein